MIIMSSVDGVKKTTNVKQNEMKRQTSQIFTTMSRKIFVTTFTLTAPGVFIWGLYVTQGVWGSGRSIPGPGGMAPPRWRPGNFFASILILLLSRLHIRWAAGTLKWLFVEGFYFPKGLCLPPFAVSVLCIACSLQQQVL